MFYSFEITRWNTEDLPYKFINKSSFNVKFLPHVFVCYLFLLFLNQISSKLSTEITKIINKKCFFSFEGMFLRTNENVAFELKLQNILRVMLRNSYSISPKMNWTIFFCHNKFAFILENNRAINNLHSKDCICFMILL